MYDVLFVIPSYHPTMVEEFGGTLLLATILKQKGLKVQIHRFFEADTKNGIDLFVEQTVKIILKKDPKIVSFYCRCDCYLANLMVAKRLKELRPDIFVVFGGPQADIAAYDTLNEIPWVDFCCRGEGETTVYPLFSALLNGGDPTGVAGLCYRDADGKICQNEPPELIADLDTLPMIDYSFIPDAALQHSLGQGTAATVEVGRGCPFNCAYCSSSRFWKRKFRMKSAGRIVDEMIYMNEQLGFTKFIFEHDLFTASKKKVFEFTKALKDSGKQFIWACSSRVDTLDEETIDEMASCGLRSVFLGVESGSERMQKLMNKNLKKEDIIRTVTALGKRGIKMTASFIYALPEETEEDIEQTLQLAYKLRTLGAKVIQFHLCAIFDGTEYYYRYADKLSLSTAKSDVVGDFGVLECQDFISEHKKLFSYCYEYKSDIRDRYILLGEYGTQTIAMYEKFMSLMPEQFENKKLTELALEVIHMYNKPPEKSGLEIIKDYCHRYFTGETQTKMEAIFDFYIDQRKAVRDPDFVMDAKTYPIDINAVIAKKKLDDIPLQSTLVCFKKQGKKVAVVATPM